MSTPTPGQVNPYAPARAQGYHLPADAGERAGRLTRLGAYLIGLHDRIADTLAVRA